MAEQRLADIKDVANLTGHGLLVTDPATRQFIACNPTACEQLGYSESELLELSPEHIQADPEHNAAWVEQEIKSIIKTGFGHIETRHRAKNGSILDVWINSKTVELDGQLAIATLIIDRSQERYRDFLQKQIIELHKEAERLSGIGAWKLRITDGRMQYSALTYQILHLDPDNAKYNLWSFTSLIHRDDRSRWRGDLRRALARGEDLQGRYRLEALDQPSITIQMEGRVILNEEGQPVQVIGTVEDVSCSESNDGGLERLRLLDPLTSLLNKTAIQEMLKSRLTGRGYNESLAVLSLDLDGFQEINDGFGTETGDALLIAIATRLRQICGSNAEVGRIGSDEFVIVLEQSIHSLGDAMRFARRLEKRWSELPPLISSLEANPSFCLGLASYPEHAQQAETLLQSANTALMQAKRQGRGQICPYSSTLSRQIRERLQLSGELAQAIEADQLSLQVQPQFTTTGALAGGEILLRWTNSRGVAIPASQFIALAEQSGQIFALGQWVLQHTLQQIQIWREQDLPVPRLAINLSVRELDRPTDQLLGGLIDALTHHQVDANQLELEITETALLRNPLQARQKLSQLAEQGFQIAIDDFGTGYSSLELLRNLPIHKLKIDKTFIDGVAKSPADETIVKSIITLAHGLGLSCIAEGVEHMEELERLQQLGCDFIQGYYYSKPLDLDLFTALLREIHSNGAHSIAIEAENRDRHLAIQHSDESTSRVPSPLEQMELLRGAIEISQSCYMLLRAELGVDGSVIDFQIIDLNQAACDYFQQSKESFVGQLFLATFPNATSSGLLEIYANAVLTNTPVSLEGFSYPSHDLFKDERVYDISAYPLRGFLVVDWRDNTVRHQINSNLAETADHYRLLAENIVEVVVLLDANQTIQWVSPSLQPVTGWTPLQWQGKSIAEFFGSEHGDPKAIDLEVWMAEQDDIRQDRLRLKEPLGGWSWIAVSARRLYPRDGRHHKSPAQATRPEGFVLTLQPVHEQVMHEQRLLQLAHRDPLTGLETRAAILGWLRDRLQDEYALNSQPLALFFCDFDNFKQINDSLGHAAGDAVLKAIAARIRNLIRSQDHAGRFGGDEFLVLLEGVKTLQAASLIAEKLRVAIAKPIDWEGQHIEASMSIGVAIHTAGESADIFLQRADQAMYAAKSDGRNRVVALEQDGLTRAPRGELQVPDQPTR